MIRVIGGGSYGEVWLARGVLGVYRAIKVVYRRNFDDDRPFLREFEGIRRFEPISREHPGLVDILQVGRDERNGWFYYVMELADDANGPSPTRPENEEAPRAAGYESEAASAGAAPNPSIAPPSYRPKTLRSLLYRSPEGSAPPMRQALSPKESIEIARELCSALGYLHRHNLVHRDIKPSNIIFVNGTPKLADIGLVTAANEECSFVGTEGFVAPEGPGAAQADIYALGKVLYEMLTGLSAREYPNLPRDWTERPGSEVRQELNEVVLRACQGDFKRRYGSARELAADLDLLILGKSLAIRKLQRAVHRMRWVIGGIATASALLLVSAGFWVYQHRAATESQRRELREVQIARMRLRQDGWFTNSWARLERAAAIQKNQEVREQASALLAGVDAHAITVVSNLSASSAAFSPDGRLLVGGAQGAPNLVIGTNGSKRELPVQGEGPVCWDRNGAPLQFVTLSNQLVLRDAATGLPRCEFALTQVNPSAISGETVRSIGPQGELVAAADGDEVLVWSGITGQALGRAKVSATALAFSPDGTLLGAGEADGSTRVYTVPNLAELADVKPALRGNPIRCLAFARNRLVPCQDSEKPTNSWLLATGDLGATIVVWDLARRAPRAFCRGSTWTVTAVAFSPDGQLLASAGRNQPRLWDLASGQPLLQFSQTSSGESAALAFDSTGRRLATGGLADGVHSATALWELETHRGTHALRGLLSPIRKIWFSPDGRRIAALSDDWQLGVWTTGEDQLLYLFETPVGGEADQAGGCFDQTGGRLAFVSGREGCLFDLRDGRTLRRWHLNPGACDQIQLNAKGEMILLRRELGPRPRRNVWKLYELADAETPLLLREQTGTNLATSDMALLPRAERFLVWNGGPTSRPVVLRAINATNGRELWRIPTEKPKAEDFRLYFDPTGKIFGCTAWSPGSSRLRLFRVSDFAEIGTTDEQYKAIAPSGQEFAGEGGWLFPDLLGEAHGIPLFTDWSNSSAPPAFSADGQWLAFGTDEGIVEVAELAVVRKRLGRFLK